MSIRMPIFLSMQKEFSREIVPRHGVVTLWGYGSRSVSEI
jgi:hypothetical protein